MSEARVKFLACPVVFEEMGSRMPGGLNREILDFKLHSRPEDLKVALQQAIDANADYEVIVLGFGLCSMAVVGLRSQTSTLVVPRVDDCISILLGSRAAYLEQISIQPGTVYTSKGWIESRDTPMGTHERLTEKYGAERAKRVIAALYRNYKRMVFINSGEGDLERYREYTREGAARLDLNFEELEGSPALFDKMVNGVWDEEFVVVPPGREITFLDFAGRDRERRGG